jgi:hypothetical protein
MSEAEATAVRAARIYLQRGWVVISVPFGQKRRCARMGQSSIFLNRKFQNTLPTNATSEFCWANHLGG